MMTWTFWLMVIILLTIVEISTVNLVSIWFIASALVSLILSFIYDNAYLEMGVFAILGIVLMLLTKPLINKYLKPERIRTNIDRVIGMTGICTEEIKKNTIGEVKVDGKRWSAISSSKINVGDEVIIEEIDGVKLKVRKEGK